MQIAGLAVYGCMRLYVLINPRLVVILTKKKEKKKGGAPSGGLR